MVREGSRRFDALEPPRTSVRAPCTPCFFCEEVVREGSVQSNHSEPMCKNSTRPGISVMMWFEKVRGGSMHLNHPELVYEHPAHLVNPRCACAARVLCVCVCRRHYRLRSTKRPISDISSFRNTRARKIKGRFVRDRQTATVADRVPWPNPSISGAHTYIRCGMLDHPAPT